MMERKTSSASGTKTVLKGLGQLSFTRLSDPAAVDVKDGKILRIRPLHFEEKYTREEIKPWRMEKNGKVFEPDLRSYLTPYMLAYKKRVYSPNRILYPLIREDWDPTGAPGSTGPGGRNVHNRGKSKYRRISWDEATDIIASEITRVRETYGRYAVLCHGDGHGETKLVHGPHACQMLLMEKMGGYTQAVRNADSWEGWFWGAVHVWGDHNVMGHMMPADNILYDITQNSKMLIAIGCDLETTPWGFGGQFPSNVCYFWSDIGIKQIAIAPDLNYYAGVHADKWIPILPNTDAALHLAVAYTWIDEGTYDKEYVATHVVGFDQFRAYVMGEEDGEPKTPAWAAGKTGVSEWTIKALARQWAKQATSTMHYYGGSYIRGPFSHEPARLECCLMGMQGLGKPGQHVYNKMADGLTQLDLPRPVALLDCAGLRNKVWTGRAVFNMPAQIIPKTQLHQAILEGSVSSMGSTQQWQLVDDQFKQYNYPIPKEEGGTEVHMMWMDNPCRTTCWNNGMKDIEAFRSPKMECIVVQHPWLENDAVYADIILPINTKVEEEDFGQITSTSPLKGVVIEEKAIEPLGESLSDYEAVGEVAKKLGLYEEYTDGLAPLDIMKAGFDISGVSHLISWEELQEKKYYYIPTEDDWERYPAGMRLFYEDPEKYPLKTPTGKLEFFSQRLADHFPDDEERPPSPKWIEKGPSHDERISSERAKKYPLLLVSNHARWRTHAQNDDINWTREIRTHKVKGYDGYMYEPVWIHPVDAEARGIKDGDIVKLINERGTVLGGAIVWERIMPGVTYQDHGARVDMISTEPGNSIDRGGANNLISPANGTSQNCWGMATSGFLVDVQKVTATEMGEWREKYPEAFERDYGPASGLRFATWVRGEE